MKISIPVRGSGGCLYLVATPIGNLEDITLRALRVLQESDLIACEDTRRTLKLLNHYKIQKKLVSYHEHNEMTRAAELVIQLEQGARVALVSDAGMPAISDPGHHLVALCRRHNIRVVPVPGPSAVVAALSASGMPTDSFVFAGFLPARARERRRALRDLAGQSRTLVCYEAPHRLVKTLSDMVDILGDRPMVIAREVTKLHEQFLRGRASELFAYFRKTVPRGEFTLLVGPGAPPAKAKVAGSLPERVARIMRDEKLSKKAALKLAAKEFGVSRREAYKRLLEGREPA